MKKSFLIAALCAISYAVAPVVNVQRGHIACEREIWLKDTLGFFARNDPASLKSYLKMERCFVMAGGNAYLLKRDDNLARISLSDGRRLWVANKAIDPNN
ncbi:MAG: hypothetical protein LBP89_08520 [Helicobacteraceae bacterium]|jgi:hypothetical protein|nr:hypothetical protein [Helicobacteraceae bacterium]